MNIEKMREDFEAWECDSDHGPQTDRVWLMYDANTNTYPLDKIQAGWVTWQASRAALVVDLPQRYESDYGAGYYADDEGDLYQVSDIVEAIETAGVKVKL